MAKYLNKKCVRDPSDVNPHICAPTCQFAPPPVYESYRVSSSGVPL